MVFFLATFIAKFLDPVSFIIAGVSGHKTTTKWFVYIFIIAIIAALIIEILLNSTQIIRTFGSGLPIGFLASVSHTMIGRHIFKMLSKTN